MNVKWFVEAKDLPHHLPLLNRSIPSGEGQDRVSHIAEDDEADEGDGQENERTLNQPSQNVSAHGYLKAEPYVNGPAFFS